MNLADELEAAQNDAQWMRFLITSGSVDSRLRSFFDGNGHPSKQIVSDVVRQLNRTSRLLKTEAEKWRTD